jgi:hypothetical protein
VVPAPPAFPFGTPPEETGHGIGPAFSSWRSWQAGSGSGRASVQSRKDIHLPKRDLSTSSLSMTFLRVEDVALKNALCKRESLAKAILQVFGADQGWDEWKELALKQCDERPGACRKVSSANGASRKSSMRVCPKNLGFPLQPCCGACNITPSRQFLSGYFPCLGRDTADTCMISPLRGHKLPYFDKADRKA